MQNSDCLYSDVKPFSTNNLSQYQESGEENNNINNKCDFSLSGIQQVQQEQQESQSWNNFDSDEQRKYVKSFNHDLQQIKEMRLEKLKNITHSLSDDSSKNLDNKLNIQKLRINSQTRIEQYSQITNDRQKQIQGMKDQFKQFRMKFQMKQEGNIQEEDESHNENENDNEYSIQEIENKKYNQFQEKCKQDLKNAYKLITNDIKSQQKV